MVPLPLQVIRFCSVIGQVLSANVLNTNFRTSGKSVSGFEEVSLRMLVPDQRLQPTPPARLRN